MASEQPDSEPDRRGPRSGALRVGLLGRGAIGGVVARALLAGEVPGAELVGVVVSRPAAGPAPTLPLRPFEEVLAESDLVVEAAGQPALEALGPRVVGAGVDLMVLSVGSLVDPSFLAALSGGPGRLLVCSGAVGGLDILRAAAVQGPLHKVTITSSKAPATLVQEWMSDEEAGRVQATDRPLELMRGSPRQVARAFPKSANVAATVGLAAGDMDLVEAVMVADPAATLTTHFIEVEADAGRYRFDLRSNPSPDNPRSSGVVPLAVLRALGDLAGRPVTIL